MDKRFCVLLIVSALLAFIVITLGAYVRLSNAGLGCPDWPGCYGQLLVPVENREIEDANKAYPQRPVETAKAWKEMIHRYAAGILLLLVFYITFRSWKFKQSDPTNAKLSLVLTCLIIFQALLGMWTVTLLLKPVIVMAHLLGGMTVLLLLVWLINNNSFKQLRLSEKDKKIFPLAAIGLMVVYLQIFLGGWTSANYAALVCADFPVCQGQWLPKMDFANGFTFWTGFGQNYEFGVLATEARTAIHVSHRFGALVTLIMISYLCLRAITASSPRLKFFGATSLILLLVQITLGILNIKLVLPINIAVAHNGVAALLLISVGSLLYHSRSNNKLENG